MKKVAFLSLVLLAFALLVAHDATAQQSQQGQQQGQQQAQQREQGEPRDQAKALEAPFALGQKLKGVAVRNQKGEELGTVQDVIVNTSSAKVEYIVVRSGGVAGFGGKSSPVPLGAFQVSKDGGLILDMTKEQLERAPSLAANEWPPANEKQWAQQLDTYYRQMTAQAGQEATGSRQAQGQPGAQSATMGQRQ